MAQYEGFMWLVIIISLVIIIVLLMKDFFFKPKSNDFNCKKIDLTKINENLSKESTILNELSLGHHNLFHNPLLQIYNHQDLAH